MQLSMKQASPYFDEMMTHRDGQVRPHYDSFARWLAAKSPEFMSDMAAEAEVIFRRVGSTRSVSSRHLP
jgi:uncharacterized circularly permuted ATP-grasp superfamily protein